MTDKESPLINKLNYFKGISGFNDSFESFFQFNLKKEKYYWSFREFFF